MEFGDIVYIGLISGLMSAAIIIIAANMFLEGIVNSFRSHMREVMTDDDDIVDCYITFADDRGLMYMYSKEDNEFIAQGTSWEELNKNTKKRYPDKMFNVPTVEIKKAMEFNK